MKSPSPTDVAEMKARGYDSSTIAEAVCQIIDTAFAGVTLGRGIGLREAQGLDDYAGAAACVVYRANDEKNDWHRVPATALNHCHSSLSFFDAAGMRFHLPAFLIAFLRGEYSRDMTFCLTHLSDYSISQFALLSSTQRAAVRAFLLHLADDPDEQFHHADIARALTEFWTEPPSTHVTRTA